MRLELEKKQNGTDEIDGSCDTPNWLPQLRIPILSKPLDPVGDFANPLMYNNQVNGTVHDTTVATNEPLSQCHSLESSMQLVRTNSGESLDLHYAYRDDYPSTSAGLIDHHRLSLDQRVLEYNATIPGSYSGQYANYSSDYCDTSLHYQQQSSYVHSSYPILSIQTPPLIPPLPNLPLLLPPPVLSINHTECTNIVNDITSTPATYTSVAEKEIDVAQMDDDKIIKLQIQTTTTATTSTPYSNDLNNLQTIDSYLLENATKTDFVEPTTDDPPSPSSEIDQVDKSSFNIDNNVTISADQSPIKSSNEDTPSILNESLGNISNVSNYLRSRSMTLNDSVTDKFNMSSSSNNNNNNNNETNSVNEKSEMIKNVVDSDNVMVTDEN